MVKANDVNDLIEVRFQNMTFEQMLFTQAVIVPAITDVIETYADALVELGKSYVQKN